MVPAHERLDPDDRAVAQGHDGLVVERELVAFQRPAQVVLDAQPADRTATQPLVVELVAGAAALLGAVHRRLGVADEILRPLAALCHRDPDRGGDEVLVAVEHERAGEDRGDPLGHLDRVVLAGDLLEQDPELVGAEAGHGVRRAHGLLEARRGGREQLVADVMAHRVVDELEAIEVEEQDRGLDVAPAQALDRLAEPVHEQHAVGQIGQRVVQRAVADVVLGELALERVTEHIGQGLGEVDVDPRVGTRAQAVQTEDPERPPVALDRDGDAAPRTGVGQHARLLETGFVRPVLDDDLTVGQRPPGL